jgi:hypothetical protein
MTTYFLQKPFRKVFAETAFIVAACLGVMNQTEAQTIMHTNGTIYVRNREANSDYDGSSWEKAHNDLAAVLNYAKNNSNVKQIWVAAGTYYPTKPADGTSTSYRDRAFVLVSGVKIYGGFPNTGSPTLADRDWSKDENRTILSGNLNENNDIDVGNAYHVVIFAGNGSNAAYLDGFTITGGKANGENSIKVNNKDIYRSSGGGISNTDSLVLNNIIVHDNLATAFGGGIYNNASSSSLIMTNVAIIGNSAKNGGGLYNISSSPVMTNVTISGNNATESGGGIYNLNYSSPAIINSIIWGNGNNNVSEDGSATSKYAYSLVQGNGKSGTNIDDDPKFEGNSYQLHLLSPAVNAGSDAEYLNKQNINNFAGEKDLAGGRRKIGQRIDMGAYENQIIPKITIESQPSDTIVTKDTNDGSLRVNASVDPDYDGQLQLKYQWYRTTNATNTVEGTRIEGATGASYDIPTDPEGVYYYYAIISTINADTATRIAKVNVKAHRNDKPEIIVNTITETSITLNEVNGAEYRIDIPDSTWKDERIFGNLTPNKEYTLYIRYKETETKYASQPSNIKVATLKATLAGEITIIGSASLNQTLSVDTSTLITNVPGYRDFGKLSYQWRYYTKDVVGGDTLDIAGATNNPTFTITSNNIKSLFGKSICVTVKAENVAGEITAVKFTSTPGTPNQPNQPYDPNNPNDPNHPDNPNNPNSPNNPNNPNNPGTPGIGEPGGPGTPGDPVVVGKGVLTVADLLFVPDSVTYNGKAQGVTVSPASSGITGIGAITVKYNGSETTPVNAGKYSITVDVAEGDYYTKTEGLKLDTFAIVKDRLKAGDFTVVPASATYDGTAKEVVVSINDSIGKAGAGTILSVTYTYNGNGSEAQPVDAGNYAVAVNVSPGENYHAATGLSLGNFVINKAVISPAVLRFATDTVATYDGTAKSVGVSMLNITEIDASTITLKYNGTKGSSTYPVDAGKYPVTVDIPGSVNYEAVNGMRIGNLTIDRAELKSGDFSFRPDSIPYNGSGQGVTVSVNEKLRSSAGKTITLKYDGREEYPVVPGKYTVTVDVSDEGKNYRGTTGLNLGVFIITKIARPAPLTPPVLQSKTATRITLRVVSDAQYRLGTTGEWQDSPVFTGLFPDTEYKFYTRIKEDEIYNVSSASPELKATTDDAPSYGISLQPWGNHTFITMEYGYGELQTHSVDVSNIGKNPTGMLSISLSGEGSNAFVLSKNFINDLEAGDTGGFTLVTKAGLATGVYLATVTVGNGVNGIQASFDAGFTVSKVSQESPPALELKEVSSTRVILKTIAGAEYCNGNGEWQDSPIFNGLVPNTAYVFYARYKSTGIREASLPCEGLTVVTEIAPNHGIALNPPGNYTFPADTFGYIPQKAYKVIISNVGNLPSNTMLVTLSGDNGNRFILSSDTIGNLDPGQTSILTIEPKTGLAIGDYNATVAISGINNISASFAVNFAVNKARLQTPPAPTLASLSATNITLTTVAGAQYRNGATGEWQDSPSFNGLTPNTEYTFYMRMKAVERYDESFPSDVLPVATNDTPEYGISLLPAGNYTFPPASYGYGEQASYGVVISNTGNSSAGTLNISLNGEGNGGFVLSRIFIDSIPVAGYEAFTVTPKTGLAPGVYLATLTVAGVNDLSTGFDVSITVSKNSQTAPAPPTLTEAGATNVILTHSSTGIEYRNGDGEWQDSPVFEGLVPGTAYVFYSRKKETATHEASPSSDALTVITKATPKYGISLNPSGNHTFASDTCGYLDQPKYVVRVTNVGNQPSGRLDITLSDDNSNRFKLSALYINSLGPDGSTIFALDPGASTVFTVVPVNGLDSGTYVAKVTVGNAHVAGSEFNISASFDVSFRVNQARQLTPPSPKIAHVKDSITATSVTLEFAPGVEYRMGNGKWQDSHKFDSLAPFTAYSFYARMKETETHLPSPSSGSLTVTTLDTRAEILRLVINGVYFDVSDTVDYRAECNETQVDLELTVSTTATINVDGAERYKEINGDVRIDNINLDGNLTTIPIEIRAQDGRNRKICILMLYRTLDGNKLLFKRWNNVIAVNTNPANNGLSYNNGVPDTVSSIRWYRSYDDGFDNYASDEWYVKLPPGVERYQALVLINGRWYHECGEPTARSLKRIIAYPNPVPVGDNLNLYVPEHLAGGYLNIHTLSGSTVKRRLPLPDENNIINVSDLSPGIYLLNITGADGNSETVKVIVN